MAHTSPSFLKIIPTSPKSRIIPGLSRVYPPGRWPRTCRPFVWVAMSLSLFRRLFSDVWISLAHKAERAECPRRKKPGCGRARKVQRLSGSSPGSFMSPGHVVRVPYAANISKDIAVSRSPHYASATWTMGTFLNDSLEGIAASIAPQVLFLL